VAGVRIDGARRLRATLKRAGSDLSDLKAANRHAASTVAPVAAAMAPKRTGRLAPSVRVGATAKAGIIRAGRKRVPYAGPIHWGWLTRPNPAQGWAGGPIRGNPFMTRAAQVTEPTWVPIYEKELLEAIRKVKGKR
jgi:hypothetical protein